MKTALLTCLALLAFAGNSVLCRLALTTTAGEQTIDAASFTAIRLLSGIVMLMVLLGIKGGDRSGKSKGSWFASFMLFIYALGFSFAYVSLDTGTGALILFGMVQVTMIGISVRRGNKLQVHEGLGVVIAFAGFTYLMLPGASAPSFSGFVLMAAAGIAWGLYTLAGTQSKHPLSDTTYNFTRCAPLVAILLALSTSTSQLSKEGILLAVLSGALASGLGYTLWYMALEKLSAIQAASLQLLVPLIATLGGVIFADEQLSLRLIAASALILGGVMVVILGRARASQV